MGINEALEVQSGKVRWHSKDREEVYRKVAEMHPRRFAILYTGTMPEDTAIVQQGRGPTTRRACFRGRGPDNVNTERRRKSCGACQGRSSFWRAAGRC